MNRNDIIEIYELNEYSSRETKKNKIINCGRCKKTISVNRDRLEEISKLEQIHKNRKLIHLCPRCWDTCGQNVCVPGLASICEKSYLDL